MGDFDPLACFGHEGEEEDLFGDVISDEDEGPRGDSYLAELLRLEEPLGSKEVPEGGPPGGGPRFFEPLRQVCIWVIDADRSLLFQKQRSPEDEGNGTQESLDGSCFWKELMDAGASYVRSRLCSREPLFFGLVIFNAVSSAGEGPPSLALQGAPQRALVTPGITLAVPLQEASVQTVEALGALAQLDRSAFDDTFPEPTEKPPFSDLWWTLGSLLKATQQQKKRVPQQQRVFLFTGNANPCSSSSSSSSSSSEEATLERNACIQRAQDLQSEQTELRLFPLELQDQSFDFSLFWREALKMQEGEEPFYLLLSDVRAGIERAGRRPRLLSSLEFWLSPSFRIPVCLYTCISPPSLLRPQPVLTPSGVPLLPGQKWRAQAPVGPLRGPSGGPSGPSGASPGFEEGGPQEEAAPGGPKGEEVTPDELVKVLEHGNRIIEVTEEEMKAVRSGFGPPCMRLLGFVPLSSLSLDRSVSLSLFVAAAFHALAEPAKRRQLKNRDKGIAETRDATAFFTEASRMLSSLILAMETKQVAAVVSFVPRRGSGVMLAALLPQLQEVDERGVTVHSSGLHLIRLPFREETRSPPVSWACRPVSASFLSRLMNSQETETAETKETESSINSVKPQPLDVQEEQMLNLTNQVADILKRLEIVDFDVQQIPNSQRARQMAAIEAFALRLSLPAAQEDALQPDKERFAAVDPLFLQWAERVRDAAPAAEGPQPGRGKRGVSGVSPTSPAGTKKAAKVPEYDTPSEERVRALVAAGQLETLTVPQLRGALARWKLRVGGNKADLVARIRHYLHTS